MESLVILAALISYSSNDVYKMPTRYFALPINLSMEERRNLDHILLHVSIDEGKTWICVDKVKPDSLRFTFLAPRNSVYWFLQQRVNDKGKKHPPKLSAKSKGIVKVRVDSEKMPLEPIAREKLRKQIREMESKLDELEKTIRQIELRNRLKRLEKEMEDDE